MAESRSTILLVSWQRFSSASELRQGPAHCGRQTGLDQDSTLGFFSQSTRGRCLLLCDTSQRCHATERSCFTVTCATDHALETSCPHSYKAVHTADFGQVAFTIDAQAGCPIHLTKYMVYYTSQTASPEELCGRAEWT